jgi:hypothetical protein
MAKLKESPRNPFVSAKETKDDVIHFRVAASQKNAWLGALKALEVTDQSAFFRGAIEAAIAMSFRAKDPKWKEFILAVQNEAKLRLGAGLGSGGAVAYERAGKGVKTVKLEALEELFRSGKISP